MKSWKTTVLGILAGITVISTQLTALLDNDPSTEFQLGLVLAALGTMGIGLFARDNDKSSEEAGAK
jgi:hypothetical protein